VLHQFQYLRLHSLAARIAWCAGIGIFAAGCSTPRKIDPSFVASRWSTTLSAFNIDPVFLPRQVHLGDIYLAGEFNGDPDGDAKRWQRRTVYLGRASVRDAIILDTQSRLRIPRTSVAEPRDDVFDAPPLTTSLRPVAFPGFNVSEIRESDFAAAFPIKLFRALFGASSSGKLVMSISVPNAEYEEVPGLDAWDKLGEFCWKQGEAPVCAASNPVLQNLFNNLKLPNDSAKLVPKVGIVTSVFYAREINYFYNTGQASAFGLTASLPMSPTDGDGGAPAKPAATDPKATGNSSLGSGGPATPPAASGAAGNTAVGSAGGAAAPATTPSPADADAAALHARVQALQKQIDELQKKGEGTSKFGAIRVVSSTNEGTLLSQTFEHPVAIGYRALWMYPLGYTPPSTTILPPAQ
jgi:hypothetical protein